MRARSFWIIGLVMLVIPASLPSCAASEASVLHTLRQYVLQERWDDANALAQQVSLEPSFAKRSGRFRLICTTIPADTEPAPPPNYTNIRRPERKQPAWLKDYLRGQAAGRLGLYEQAITYFNRAAACYNPDLPLPTETKHILESSRGEAALCAIRLHDYTRALASLPTGGEIEPFRQALSHFAEGKPAITDYLAFTNALIGLEEMPFPDRHEELLLMRQAYRLPLTLEEKRELTLRVGLLTLQDRNLDMLDFLLAQHWAGAPADEMPAQLITEMASRLLYWDGNREGAQRLVKRMVDRYRGTYWEAEGYFLLAQCSEGEQRRRYYEQTITTIARVAPERGFAMNGPDIQFRAHEALGDEYFRRGEYCHALGHYSAWQPGWKLDIVGGDTFDSDNSHLRIARCLVGLGNYRQAIYGHLLPWTLEADYKMNLDLAQLTVLTYERLGALDELQAELAPHLTTEEGKDRRAKGTAEILQYHRWAEEKAIDKLLPLLRPENSSIGYGDWNFHGNWHAAAAARALADVGGAEFPCLKALYEEALAVMSTEAEGEIQMHDRRSDYDYRAMLAYAISLSRSPDAEPYLRGLLRRAEIYDKALLARQRKLFRTETGHMLPRPLDYPEEAQFQQTFKTFGLYAKDLEYLLKQRQEGTAD